MGEGGDDASVMRIAQLETTVFVTERQIDYRQQQTEKKSIINFIRKKINTLKYGMYEDVGICM